MYEYWLTGRRAFRISGFALSVQTMAAHGWRVDGTCAISISSRAPSANGHEKGQSVVKCNRILWRRNPSVKATSSGDPSNSRPLPPLTGATESRNCLSQRYSWHAHQHCSPFSLATVPYMSLPCFGFRLPICAARISLLTPW